MIDAEQLRRLRDGVKARVGGSFEPPKFLGVDVAALLESRDAAVAALSEVSAREGEALAKVAALIEFVNSMMASVKLRCPDLHAELADALKKAAP